MGFRQISLQLPTHFSEDELRKKIAAKLKIRQFSYRIDNKSLDARKKSDIFWQMSLIVQSDELKGENWTDAPALTIPRLSKKAKVVVVGNGPAGYFAARVLQLAGAEVTMIERGMEVGHRSAAIEAFERGGSFDPQANYGFGEGGAGTFSDGKLTSRSKHISQERKFIFQQYIEAGAPAEIAYMAHPHLGTDNLRKIVKQLRLNFVRDGGSMHYQTMMTGLYCEGNTLKAVETNAGTFESDLVFVATGHSAFETYRMLMKLGVQFNPKQFALGCRMEHPQEIINIAQWGRPRLPGVKAAEYRLTSSADGQHQVYSFCMCPGGMVVPAAVYPETNIVNGMSYYKRDGAFANAACVAGIHPAELAGREISAAETLDMLEQMEGGFFKLNNSYEAPACNIGDFIRGKSSIGSFRSSHPLGTYAAPLFQLLPKTVVQAMQAGLSDFSRKITGFETGTLLGLESKTSAPVQVVRDDDGRCHGFSNLYVIGEGSGFAGGIVSSAADGVKSALKAINLLG